MFISNRNECIWNRCGNYSDEEIFVENEKFAVRINTLIKEGTPIKDWTSTFVDEYISDLEFVSFNYTGMTYLYGNEGIYSASDMEYSEEDEVITYPKGWTFADEIRYLGIDEELFGAPDEGTTEDK